MAQPRAARAALALIGTRFLLTKCGSRLTDAVVMGKGGVGVQPWRQMESSRLEQGTIHQKPD